MNLQEFAALKAGDKIENPMNGSAGEVVETTDNGVRVVWGPRHGHETRFFFSVQGTAWMHWSKVRMCPSGVPCTSDRCEAADQCLGGDYDAIAKGATP